MVEARASRRAAAECRHRRSAGQGFAMVRHQFGFAQPDLDVRLDDGFRIGAGDPVEAVSDGANLDAAELRVDLLRAKRPGQRHGRQRNLAHFSSGEFHMSPFNGITMLPAFFGADQ